MNQVLKKGTISHFTVEQQKAGILFRDLNMCHKYSINPHHVLKQGVVLWYSTGRPVQDYESVIS